MVCLVFARHCGQLINKVKKKNREAYPQYYGQEWPWARHPIQPLKILADKQVIKSIRDYESGKVRPRPFNPDEILDAVAASS